MNFFLSGPTRAHRTKNCIGCSSISACRRRSWGRRLGPIRRWPLLRGAHPTIRRSTGFPTYREPGRINLNTIYTPEVVQWVDGRLSQRETDLGGFRQEPAVAARAPTFLDMPAATVPTEFAHPFRSFAGANLVPPLPSHEPSP